MPAKTSTAIVAKLHSKIAKALQAPEVREQFAKQGATMHAESPAEFTAFIKAERERMVRLVEQARITLE